MPKANDPKELVKELKAGKPCPTLIFFVGSDKVRRARAVDRIAESVLGVTKRSALTRLSAHSLDGKKLLEFADGLASLALFSVRRMFVVEEADELSVGAARELIPRLKQLDPNSVCVFSSTSAPTTHPLFKYAYEHSAVWQFPDLEGAELNAWIAKELKNHGIDEFSADLPALLGRMGEGNADTILRLVTILALYVPGPSASSEDARALFKEAIEVKEFDFLDALLAKNLDRALILIQQLLADGKSPFAMMGLLQRSVSTYLAVTGALEKGLGFEEIARSLKLQPWLVKKYADIARRGGASRLKSMLAALVRADSELKNRSLGSELIYSNLVYTTS